MLPPPPLSRNTSQQHYPAYLPSTYVTKDHYRSLYLSPHIQSVKTTPPPPKHHSHPNHHSQSRALHQLPFYHVPATQVSLLL